MLHFIYIQGPAGELTGLNKPSPLFLVEISSVIADFTVDEVYSYSTPADV